MLYQSGSSQEERNHCQNIEQRELNAGDLLLAWVMETLRSLGQWRNPEIVSSRKTINKRDNGRRQCPRSPGPGDIWEMRTETKIGVPQEGLGPCNEWVPSTNGRHRETSAVVQVESKPKEMEENPTMPLFLPFWLPSELPRSWAPAQVWKQGSLANAVHRSQSSRGTEWARGRIGGSIWGQTGQEEPPLIPWRKRTVWWGSMKGTVLFRWSWEASLRQLNWNKRSQGAIRARTYGQEGKNFPGMCKGPEVSRT